MRNLPCALIFVAVFASITTACASTAPALPENARVGRMPMAAPSPRVSAPDAAPVIVFIHFSDTDLRVGSWCSGEIVTSTNVASVELRTNLFSFNIPRMSYGRFAFRLHVLDAPGIFYRAYPLRIIARNAAGVATEEDLPIRIHA